MELAILFQEIFTFYDAIKQGKQCYLPTPRPYQDYINWLQQQDISASETFWRKTLLGFSIPTPLIGEQARERNNKTYNIRQINLLAKTTANLKSFVAQNHLTLSTLVQAAWHYY